MHNQGITTLHNCIIQVKLWGGDQKTYKVLQKSGIGYQTYDTELEAKNSQRSSTSSVSQKIQMYSHEQAAAQV